MPSFHWPTHYGLTMVLPDQALNVHAHTRTHKSKVSLGSDFVTSYMYSIYCIYTEYSHIYWHLIFQLLELSATLVHLCL